MLLLATREQDRAHLDPGEPQNTVGNVAEKLAREEEELTHPVVDAVEEVAGVNAYLQNAKEAESHDGEVEKEGERPCEPVFHQKSPKSKSCVKKNDDLGEREREREREREKVEKGKGPEK